MKWRLLLLPFFLLSLIMISGCEKDDDDDDVVTPNTNQAPTIVSVRADQSVVLPSTIVTFTCVARDDDHDAITYSWSNTTGRQFLEGSTSATVRWQAVSTPGEHTFYVDVSDNELTTTDSVTIVVNDQVPRSPSDPYPYNGEIDVDLMPTFTWSCSDPQEDPLTYNIYLGLGSASELLAEGVIDTFYISRTALLPGNLYRWKVVARDDENNINESPEWEFTTLTRNYGPPLHDILFIDQANSAATADTPGEHPIYVRNVGQNLLIDDPGYSVLWEPGGTAETSLLAFNDRSDNTVVLLGAGGVVDETYDNAVQDIFNFSKSGSRFCYVELNEDRQRYYMKTMGVSPISGEDTVASLPVPYEFRSRPSYSSNGTLITTTTYNSVLDGDDRFMVYTSDGDIEYEQNIRVYEPQFCPTQPIIAYLRLEADQGDRPVLHITDADFASERIYIFDEFGGQAKSFAWSPDGTKIALYVWDAPLDPALVIVDVDAETMMEIEIDDPIRIDTDEEHWLAPDWNFDSNELTLLTEHGTYFHLIRVDLEGNVTTIRPTLTTISRPTWRK